MKLWSFGTAYAGWRRRFGVFKRRRKAAQYGLPQSFAWEDIKWFLHYRRRAARLKLETRFCRRSLSSTCRHLHLSATLKPAEK